MIDHVHALPEGYRLQEYTITGALGFGGFGITYSALDNNLDKVVAIKEYLPGELAARVAGNTVSVKSEQDRESFDWGLDAFLNEAKTVAKFDHRNVVRIHRFFEQNGTGYIVMEFIEGRTLSSVLKEQGTLEESEIRAWLWPVMDGLKVVHKAGYLHRDIKPQNIMMRKDGRPCVLDFGAARMAMGGMTRSLTAIMTPGFAPLEQYETRGNQGPWTDIYALGAVMYGCIAGHKPKDALDRIRNDALETPDSSSEKTYSKGLLRGITAALSMQEEDRPQDINALLKILDVPEESTLAMPEKPKAQPSVAATRRVSEKPEPPPHRLTSAPLPPMYADVDVVREKPEISESKGIGKWLAIAILPVLIIALGIYWWMGDQEEEPVTQTTNGTAQRESKPAVQKPQSVSAQKPESVVSEPESVVSEKVIRKYALTIIPEPADATVRILDVGLRFRQGMMLEPGSYQVEISREGYETQNRWLEIADQTHTTTITLKLIQYALTIETVPVGASVIITNSERPYRAGMSLVPGRYFIEVAQPGYDTFSKQITIQDRNWVETIRLNQTRYALVLETTPSDANVRFLSSTISYSPGMMLEPGSYHVEVNKQGYVSRREVLEIVDRTLVLPFALEKEISQALSLKVYEELKRLGYLIGDSGAIEYTTSEAIRRFEKDSGLQETGEINERLFALLEQASNEYTRAHRFEGVWTGRSKNWGPRHEDTATIKVEKDRISGTWSGTSGPGIISFSGRINGDIAEFKFGSYRQKYTMTLIDKSTIEVNSFFTPKQKLYKQ